MMNRQSRKKEFYFPSTDGSNRIHTVVWMPDRNRYPQPRGIVQIAHGMVEYIERYDGLARYLNERGFVAAGNDHLGHGKSVKSTEDWGYFTPVAGSAHVVADMRRVSLIMKKRFPGLPFYLLGHSMGSFLARRYMMTYGSELDGVILLGTGNPSRAVIAGGLVTTAVMGMCRGERYRSELLRRLMFGSYNRRIKNPKTDNDWVCSDETVMEAYNRDSACTFIFTVNGIQVLMKTLLFIENKINIEKIPKELPILMASGKEDPVGNYGRAVEKIFRIYKDAGIKDIHVRLFDGCRHELHNEVIRKEIYEMIGDWLVNKSSRQNKG